MASTKLWYISEGANTAINQIDIIMGEYNKVVKAAMNVGNTLKTYVNKKDKWNDENSEVFAAWWNANKNLAKGGDLVWNSKKEKLEMTQKISYSDGEDRIKLIVGAAGCAFYATVCKTINALTASYPSIKTNASTQAIITVANSSIYSNKFKKKDNELINGITWQQMMQYIGGKGRIRKAEVWDYTKLPTKKSGSVTKTGEVNKLINQLSNKLNTLQNRVEDYSSALRTVANNKKDTKWWGFDSTSKNTVQAKTKTMLTETKKKLKDFSSKTKVALDACAKTNNIKLNKIDTTY